MEALLERVEGARADVAEDDAERADRELPDTGWSTLGRVGGVACGVAWLGHTHVGFLRFMPKGKVGGQASSGCRDTRAGRGYHTPARSPP